MMQEQIYSQAIDTVKARRRAAQEQQERRSEQLQREIPEIAELEQQLRAVCMEIAGAIGSGQCAERIRAIEQHSLEADAMLRKLLTAHGYPEDYLDVHYTCPACSDTGFVGGRPCTCLERETGRICAEELNRHSRLALSGFETFSLRYYSNLPTEQYLAMEQNLEFCRQYADTFSPSVGGNILMLGNTGLGKTHLSLAVAAVLLQKGYSVIYDSAGSMLHRLEQEHFGKAEGSGTLDMLLECDLLILDDFGTEFDTSFTRSMIYTIINSRINSGKPLIINTNLTSNEIKERYGDRILSRLLFASKILHFYGKDIRIQKSAQQNRSQEART